MKLSILIPVYNEEKTIAKILQRVSVIEIPQVTKEIIVINDGSTDTTESIIINVKTQIPNIKTFTHHRNMGKGAAIKTGINSASGDYIIIQDADLEYNPEDIASLVDMLLKKKAQVVYGTRLRRLPHFKKEEKSLQFFLHYTGNRILSLLTSLFYGQWLTDMETGYKLFPRKAVAAMTLRAKGFEFEPEITAKLLKAGYKILEVPITTQPRGYNEGKKLRTFHDGWKAFYQLVKFRFVS